MLGGVRVKRGLAALLALLLMLSLCGCQQNGSNASPSASVKPTVVPMADDPLEDLDEDMDDLRLDADDPSSEDPGPADDEKVAGETPAAPQTQGISTSQYTYSSVENTELGITYKYPTHWTNISSESSIGYEDSESTGACPARMAITRRDAGEIVVTEGVGMMRLSEFAKKLKDRCSENWKMKKGKRFKFSNNIGFCFTYSGVFDGIPMKGYVSLCYQKKKNSFYLFHFSTAEAEYATFDKVRATIQKSIKV